MRRFLTMYHPRFVRSLVYMLQASEYHITDYLLWFGRVEDFRYVEKRKKLVITPKAAIFLVLGYAGLYTGYAFLVFLALSSSDNYILVFLGLLLLPGILAYALSLLLFLFGAFVQRPVEYIIVRLAAERLKKHPAVKIGIAGSFGKTTFREILKTVLSEGKRVSAPPASYNTPLGIAKFIRGLRGDEEILIFEFGEYYPGDVAVLSKIIAPDIGIITGANEAHLEKFKTLEKTVKTIFELSSFLSPDKLYINSENEQVKKRARPQNILYSRRGVGDLRVIKARTGLAGTDFAVQGKNISWELHSGLLGLHQVGPLVAAAHIALGLGLSEDEIQRGISATQPFPHRLEPQTGPQGAIILDDSYNGNPDGVEAVINFLSGLQGKRRWYVTPGLVETGKATETVHRAIGERLSRTGIEKVVLIRNSVTPFIEEGLRKGGYSGGIQWFETMTDFLASLPHLVLENDIILIQNDWPDQYS